MQSTSPAPGALDLAAQLRDDLRKEIARGVYAPGAKLVEREISTRYGLGRTAVRDALRHLAAEGILELNENRGARVSDLNYATALDIYQVRVRLEGLAGELFATRGTTGEKLRFAESLPPIRDAMEAGKVTAALEASDVFFSILLVGSGNAELRAIVTRLHVRISQIRRVTISMQEQNEATLAGLQRIVDAVLAGHADSARQACEDHVNAAATATLPAIAMRFGRIEFAPPA